MTICRFYLQGRCRYGDRCWNEHTSASLPPQRRDNYSWVPPSVNSYGSYSTAQFPRGNYSSSFREPPGPRYNYDYGHDFDYNYDSRSSSPSRNQYSGHYLQSSPVHQYSRPASESYERTFAPNKNTSFQLKTSNRFAVVKNDGDTGKNVKDGNIISIIKDEVTDWENTHMWPFSCCSHFKDRGACVPGFVDVSPEELRHIAYEAEKNGIFATYVETVAAALGEIRKKWSVLQNPTPEILQSIQKGYCGTPDFCEENLKKLILTHEAITVSSYDDGQHNSAMFLQPQNESTTSGPFSFKQAHLGASESLGSPSSAFQSVLPSANKGVRLFSSFSAPSSGFASSAFASSSGFASSEFASSSGSSVPSGFGSSSESRFPNTKASGNSTDAKSCAYTQLQNLTDTEKAQFSSQTFTLGKIPSRPPPVEMCF